MTEITNSSSFSSSFMVGCSSGQEPSFTISNQENSLNLLKILPSGIITRPYQPFFHAIVSSHFSIPTETENKILPDYVIANIGEHFNLSTGMFTAPVDAVYNLKCHARLVNNEHDNTDGKLQLNAGGFIHLAGQRSWSSNGVRLRVSMEVIQAILLKAGETAHCSFN